MTITISKITRAGQITLPKKIRTSRAFARSKAVMFEERGDEVIVRPLAPDVRPANDHWPVVVHSMQDWLDEVNDDLLELPKDL